jgi:hypothetical protein
MSSSQQRAQPFRSAGVSPAIFLISKGCKNGGETPALQQIECGKFVARISVQSADVRESRR